MATNRFNLSAIMGGLVGNDFVTLPAQGEMAKGGLLFASDQTESVILGVTLEDYASALSMLIPTYMKDVNSGKIDFEVEVMKIEDGDAADGEIASFDSVNEIVGGTTVAGTAKYPTFITIPCANDDSPTGAEVGFIFRINRDHDDADDTALGTAAIGPIIPISGSYTTV